MDKEDYGHFKARLFAKLDRQDTISTDFSELLKNQYAGSSSFRDATASRIVLEAGSGRTRAETNNPTPTSAAGNENA
jgi:hypothetical protein